MHDSHTRWDDEDLVSSFLFMERITREHSFALRKPAPPKRVSSAKPDTVNKVERLEISTAAVSCDSENGSTYDSKDPEPVVQTQPPRGLSSFKPNMGSGSSIQQEPVAQGTYRQRENYLTLSHAQVSNDAESLPIDSEPKYHTLPLEGAFLHPANLKTDFEEFGKIKKSPLLDLKFKKSTFRGGSMSAVTLQRDSFQKTPERQSYTSLASFFPQRGKYNFNKNNSLERSTLNSPLKPTTILHDSEKLHQNQAPDITLTPDPSSNMLDNYDRSAALIYGTLPNPGSSSASTGSSGLLQKSKSRVRNSLRNLRFYSRNLTSEPDKEAPKPQQDLLPPGSEYYGAIMTHRDLGSPEKTWLDERPLSLSYDSGLLLHQKQQTPKTAVAVQIPSVSAVRLKPPATNDQSFGKNSSISRPTSLSLEQESIAVLDEVLASHSRNLTSISSMKSCISETKMATDEKTDQKYEISRYQDSKVQNNSAYAVVGSTQSLNMPEPAVLDSTQPGIRTVTPVETQAYSSGSNSPTKIPVKKGLSISDVLSQGNLSDILPSRKARSLSGSSVPHVASLQSQGSINFDSDSFDDSFVSTSGSQELTSNELLGDQQVLVSASHVRKAGWLITKHVLVSKRGKVEQAGKRNWQKFWVNMKGGHLLFYDLEGKDEDEFPKVMLPVDGALVQPVPEHAKKDNVFCLSTTTGSVYLLQGGSQTEVDGWVKSIHREAAVIFAMKDGDDSTISKHAIEEMLSHDIENRKTEIEMDKKMKKMAELQMSLVSDVKSRRAITEQIAKWEESLEKNQVHVFRFRCYLSSLHDTEPPNPRTAMASACKTSKHLLGNMKLLNVSALHALVNAREDVNVVIAVSKPSTPKRKHFAVGIRRSGSFNESLKPESLPPKDSSSPAKSKKSNIFASLRGFDTWRGSVTSGGKKKQQRTSVTGIFSAFGSGSSPSSHSSTKENDEKSSGQRISERNKTPLNSRKHFSHSNSVFYEPLQGSDDAVGYYNNSDDGPLTPGSTSEDDMLDSRQNSNRGSLDSLLLAPPDAWCTPVDWNASTVRVAMSTNEFVTVTTTENMTFKQLLEIVCQRKQLDSDDYFLVISDHSSTEDLQDEDSWTVPEKKAHLSEFECENLLIKKKRLYSIELKNNKGFTVLPKVVCRPLVVDNVMPKHGGGLQCGDEILTVNGELLAEMNNKDAAKRLSEGPLRLLVRTCYYQDDSKSKIWWLAGESEPRKSQSSALDSSLSDFEKTRKRSEELMSVTEEYLQKIVVPPPPVISRLQPPYIRSPFTTAPRPDIGARHGSAEDIISLLVVPAPDVPPICNGYGSDDGNKHDAAMSGSEEFINELLRKAETITSMCRQLHVMGSSTALLPMSPDYRDGHFDGSGVHEMPDVQRQLSEVEKVYKVLHELVDTETIYVKDLECLLKRYLEPLHTEGFLVGSEMDSLLQNVQGMLQFQQTFLLELSQDFDGSKEESDIAALNRSLLSVASAFLQHAAQFKLYAAFSTCHTVAQDVIERTKLNSSAFREFLDARNPKKQHSSTVESYLIKPIQRVLKYPLLLRELLNLGKSLEQVNSRSRRRLKAALQAMNGVARHINDSQTVHDEFGGEGFKEIMKQALLKTKYEHESPPSLSLSELLCYCTTEWLNVFDELGKLKKGSVMEVLVLVFRSAVVLLCRGTKRDKKKATTPLRETTRPRATAADFVYTNVITRTELSVDGNCPAYSTEKSANIWQLNQEHVSGLRTVYRLGCESVELKQRVVKTIEYVIKNCARDIKYKEEMLEDPTPLTEEKISNDDEMMPESKDPQTDCLSRHSGSSSSSSSPALSHKYKKHPKRPFFYDPEHSPTKTQEKPYFPSGADKSETPSHSVLKVQPTKTSSSPIMSARHRVTSGESRQFKTVNAQNEGSFGLEISTLPGHGSPVSRSSSFQSHRSPHLRSEFLTFSSAPVSPSHSLNSSQSSLAGLRISTQKQHTIHDSKTGNRASPQRTASPVKYNPNSPAKYNMVYGVAPYESKL